MRWKRRVCVLLLLVGFGSGLGAMERFEALWQIESGGDDCAVGPAGEVSRFQMRPEVWQQYAHSNADFQCPVDAIMVALRLMEARCSTFQRTYGRPPDDLEFYVLWNAPAQVQNPGKVVLARAQRFCNLVKRQ